MCAQAKIRNFFNEFYKTQETVFEPDSATRDSINVHVKLHSKIFRLKIYLKI